jgi:hypothetical protein
MGVLPSAFFLILSHKSKKDKQFRRLLFGQKEKFYTISFFINKYTLTLFTIIFYYIDTFFIFHFFSLLYTEPAVGTAGFCILWGKTPPGIG